jgi:hypothetical protein
MVLPVEAVAAVGEPVGPGNQRGAVSSIAHLLDRVGLQHRPAGDRVLAYAPSDLDDHGSLLAKDDLELLTRRYASHASTSP